LNCTDCGNEVSTFESFNGRCGKCHAVFLEASATGKTVEQLREQKSARQQKVNERSEILAKENMASRKKNMAIHNMILTTETAHNLPVGERLGIISAEIVVGMNVFKDFFAGVRNVVGGRSSTVQNALRDIRVQALDELKREAATLGADAVVGVDLDYNEIGATGSTMLMLVASGTAVTLQSDNA
jgi:uncharacterized protein YbjQ (UPF0145 family)